MKKCIALVVICTLSLSCYAAYVRTGEMLLHECGANPKIPLKEPRSGCEHYIKGVVMGSKLVGHNSVKCLPNELSMNQQADVVVTFLKTHPNELQANAPRLIEKSLQEKYPCTTEIKK